MSIVRFRVPCGTKKRLANNESDAVCKQVLTCFTIDILSLPTHTSTKETISKIKATTNILKNSVLSLCSNGLFQFISMIATRNPNDKKLPLNI